MTTWRLPEHVDLALGLSSALTLRRLLNPEFPSQESTAACLSALQSVISKAKENELT
jgi:hypothetical protein